MTVYRESLAGVHSQCLRGGRVLEPGSVEEHDVMAEPAIIAFEVGREVTARKAEDNENKKGG